MGIKTLRLGAITLVQHAVTVTGDHITLAATAGGQQRQ
jgi:hypothetical protein